MKTTLGCVVVSGLALAGCSGAADVAAPPTVTETVTVTETATHEVQVTETVTETVTADAATEEITMSRTAAEAAVRMVITGVWDDSDAQERDSLCLAYDLDPEWMAEKIGGDWADQFSELPADDFYAIIVDVVADACRGQK